LQSHNIEQKSFVYCCGFVVFVLEIKTITMAKRQNGNSGNVGKNWKEGDLITTFKLTRIKQYKTLLMQDWLTVQPPTLNVAEQYLFDFVYEAALKSIEGWNEEDLKIKLIGPVLMLGQMTDDDTVIGYFDKTISATVEGIPLLVRADFMLAKGILDVFKTPYFHFQEYKPNKNPSGDSMAQLLEAFLIAQVKNKTAQPMYGVEIVGKQWTFVVMDGKEYCISPMYDATDRNSLLTIISILRKFKVILHTELMKFN
jgi:hypothetical protein